MVFQQTKPTLDAAVTLPMFLLWVVLTVILVGALWKRKWSFRIHLILLALSVLLGGFLLGGIPNAVMPLAQVLLLLSTGKLGAATLPLILPMIVVLVILVASTLVVGRVFCGVACPVGAIQEMASKWKFKRTWKDQKTVKHNFNLPKKWSQVVRGWFFLVLFLLAGIWSLALMQIVNPFLGLGVFRNPLIPTLGIPLVTLGVVVIASLFTYRPFCRLMCPFGAIAGLTSRFSWLKLVRTDACTDCGLCEKICPTQVAAANNSKGECYYCGRCIETCPQGAIVLQRPNNPTTEDSK